MRKDVYKVGLVFMSIGAILVLGFPFFYNLNPDFVHKWLLFLVPLGASFLGLGFITSIVGYAFERN